MTKVVDVDDIRPIASQMQLILSTDQVLTGDNRRDLENLCTLLMDRIHFATSEA